MKFLCNPKKNVTCRKTLCFMDGGSCHTTKHLKYFDYKQAFFFFYNKWVKGYCKHLCRKCECKNECRFIDEVCCHD